MGCHGRKGNDFDYKVVSRRNIFVAIEEFCVLSVLVVTQIYTYDMEFHTRTQTHIHCQIPGFDAELQSCSVLPLQLPVNL